MDYIIISGGGIFCLILSVIVPLIILWALNSILKKHEESDQKRIAIIKKAAFSILLLMFIVSVVASTGFFMNFEIPPRLMLVFVVMLTLSLTLTFSKKLTTFLRIVPPSWLIYIQAFRVPVELMLWQLYLEGIAPIQMTFEGRNWDILVGITALIFGYFCFKQNGWGRKVAIIWNIAGLGLLLNIVVVAILSFPTPFRVFMNEPANTMVAKFPLVLLPAVLVTVAYTMHFFSLRQLVKHPDLFENV